VDHVARRQTISGCDLRFACRAAAESTAFGEQVWPGSPMNCAIDTASAQERRIRRVHDRIHMELRDVADDDLERGSAYDLPVHRLWSGAAAAWAPAAGLSLEVSGHFFEGPFAKRDRPSFLEMRSSVNATEEPQY